ncbi:glutathione S-transferase C-terminal-like protein [Pisolithus thermaeus]|nr:glutathione S-transferase C-terminal-like protein [Pisolithus thermaeus]
MAAVGKLYSVPGQTTVLRAAVAGVELAEPDSCFESADGFNLTEDAAIARYIASVVPNSGLPGDTVEGTALVDQYVHFAEMEIQASLQFIYMSLNGYIPYNKAGQLRGFNTLEAILLTRAYLIDERLTRGDIAVASVVFLSVSCTLDALLRNRYLNVLRHLDLVIDQPALKDVFGQPTFVEKAVQYTPPAKEKKEKEPGQPAHAGS